jgi:hypothetical protein
MSSTASDFAKWMEVFKLTSSGGAPLVYKGTWDASTNTPTLVSSVGTAGNFYIVNVAGNTNLNGNSTWNVGDWVLFNGTAWERVPNSLDSAAGGDLSGTYPNPSVTKINGNPLGSTTPTNGNLLMGNGTQWVSTAPGALGKAPLTGVYAMTTTALNATYDNGNSGVGASLTNAGTLGALAIDGALPPLNSLIVVNNQVPSLQNGLYQYAVVGDASTPWKLVRPTFYDQVGEINIGDLFYVLNGTTNGASLLYMSSNVTAVGTSPISFVQTGLLRALNNLDDLTNKFNARANLGVAIGINVQAWSAELDAIASASPATGNILIGNGTNFSSHAISGDATLSNAGVIQLANSNTTRTNLGLAIGTNVQAYSAELTALSNLSGGNFGAIYQTGNTSVAVGSKNVFISGTTFTPTGAYWGADIHMNNSAAMTVALDHNQSGIALGFEFTLWNSGSGDITFTTPTSDILFGAEKLYSSLNLPGNDGVQPVKIKYISNLVWQVTPGNMAFQQSNAVVITGGSISGCSISGNSISVNNFNNGTNASTSTFLRGDGTWVAPAGSGIVTNDAFTYSNFGGL